MTGQELRTRFPMCTEPGCDHAGNELPPTTPQRRGVHVDRNGYAVCTCHPRDLAAVRGIERFDCGRTDAEGRWA